MVREKIYFGIEKIFRKIGLMPKDKWRN